MTDEILIREFVDLRVEVYLHDETARADVAASVEHLRWLTARNECPAEHWLGMLPALIAGRRAAMAASNSKRPKGRRYADCFGPFLARTCPGLADHKLATLKHTLSALLWFCEDKRESGWAGPATESE